MKITLTITSTAQLDALDALLAQFVDSATDMSNPSDEFTVRGRTGGGVPQQQIHAALAAQQIQH
jgi:hypothetical protein